MDYIFPSIAERFNNAKWVGTRAVFSLSNKEMQEVNNAVLERLSEREVVNGHESIDTTAEGGADYLLKFLNTCELSGMPPHLPKPKIPLNLTSKGLKYPQEV